MANRAIFSFLNSITTKQTLRDGHGDRKILQRFVATFSAWLSGSRESPVSGLELFPAAYYVNGVTQAYDLFFYEHKGRRFRTLRGEYPYVRVSVRDWLHVEDDELRKNDALVLTAPFYGNGAKPRNAEQLLDRCRELSIPVFIDAAYFGTCYDVAFDYSHPAIEMVGFSLSKPLCVPSYRIGILYSKRPLASLEEIQIQSNYFNKVGAYVGIRLMERFSADFIPSTYKRAHRRVCRALGLFPTNSIMLGNVGDDDRRFDRLLEDDRFDDLELPEGALRRVCISSYVSEAASNARVLLERLIGARGLH